MSRYVMRMARPEGDWAKLPIIFLLHNRRIQMRDR